MATVNEVVYIRGQDYLLTFEADTNLASSRILTAASKFLANQSQDAVSGVMTVYLKMTTESKPIKVDVTRYTKTRA